MFGAETTREPQGPGISSSAQGGRHHDDANRGRGNAWHRNPEGCVAENLCAWAACGANGELSRLPVAVPGIASNRDRRFRCQREHGAIQEDARPQ